MDELALLICFKRNAAECLDKLADFLSRINCSLHQDVFDQHCGPIDSKFDRRQSIDFWKIILRIAEK